MKEKVHEYKITFSQRFNDLLHEQAVDENVSPAEIIKRAVAYYSYLKGVLRDNPNNELISRDKVVHTQKVILFPESFFKNMLDKLDSNKKTD